MKAQILSQNKYQAGLSPIIDNSIESVDKHIILSSKATHPLHSRLISPLPQKHNALQPHRIFKNQSVIQQQKDSLQAKHSPLKKDRRVVIIN